MPHAFRIAKNSSFRSLNSNVTEDRRKSVQGFFLRQKKEEKRMIFFHGLFLSLPKKIILRHTSFVLCSLLTNVYFNLSCFLKQIRQKKQE
jgi:hypothetical protein